MPDRLSDRLSAARHAVFVGRTDECSLFASALQNVPPPFQVLHISGAGGVGKTSLLHEFGDICAARGIAVAAVDGRNLEPTTESFLRALALGLSIDSPDALLTRLSTTTSPVVLLVDSYDSLVPLDGWLREEFLPRLAACVIVVLAGQQPLGAVWHADAGWQQVVRHLPLRDLEPQDSRTYLSKRGYPDETQQAVIDFTHGYPLALSLVSDVYDQSGQQFQPGETPDLIQTLLERLIQQVPSPAHRSALELCAIARLTTRSLLGEVLYESDSQELFEWLRGLSFVQCGSRGIFPHDLARAALTADLRWRDSDWYGEIDRRARAYYNARVRQTTGAEQQRLLFDLGFLHRNNPTINSFIEWSANENLLFGSAQAAELELLAQTITCYEGEESGHLARHWFARQPDGVIVLRDKEEKIIGFMSLLSLHLTTPQDREVDPAARVCWDYLQSHEPLRAGECATLFRFWMGCDTYQQVSEAQSLLFVHVVRHYLMTPGLAFTFFPCADPEFWASAFAYVDLSRLREADFTVQGRSYGMYGHDWRHVPPMAWLESLAQREVSSAAPGSLKCAPAPPAAANLSVLSYQEFTMAVQAALRSLGKSPGSVSAWSGNALLQSRIVAERANGARSTPERVSALQALIKEACEPLQHSPREEKFYRALYHTYLHPAPSQEQAAVLMDVPFSSFRRYLKAGITRVTDDLWQREVGL